jgi:hypothetical protein
MRTAVLPFALLDENGDLVGRHMLRGKILKTRASGKREACEHETYRSVQVPRSAESAHPRRGDNADDGHGDERSEENCVMCERRWRRDRNMHLPFLRIMRPAKVLSSL